MIMAAITLTVLTSTAFAASHKICFGSTKSDETRGVVLSLSFDTQNVSLKTLKGDYSQGTYPAYHTSVKGRDGKTYLEYKGENSDYQDVIMIDSELLKPATSGLLQVRARGEGFFNAVFVCRDQM